MSMVGKIAIITGAGQGIGKAIAFALAGKEAIPVIADINENTAKNAAETHARLDVLRDTQA